MKSAQLVLVLVIWSLASFAGTLRVPQDFPTVQAAVAASVAGDSIVISPGLYAIPATPCTLANGAQSTCGLVLHDGTALVGSGPAQTVLDFSAAQIGILLQNGTATVKLAHVQNAGTALYAYVGSNISGTNLIITNSNAGMELNQGNSYTIINTTIDGIHDPSQTGSGIDVPFVGGANIQNNLVTHSDRAFTAGSFSFGTYAYNDAFGSLAFDWGECTAAGCAAVSAPATNISADPLYCPDFSLQTASPARNAGNPAISNPDGSRSDLGAYGGPQAILPPSPCGGQNSNVITLLFTNDVHGLWDKQVEGGLTVLQVLANQITAEKQNNPGRVVALDAGDVVDGLGDSVLAINDGNGGLTNYARYLLLLKSAGYDVVTIGNHDCCGGNRSFGFDWNNPAALTSAIAQAQSAGLHITSANLNSLGQLQCDPAQPTYAVCLQNKTTWLAYENQIEGLVSFTRNGLRVGVVGLTAPSTYGAGIIYDDPFGSLLTEANMRSVISSIAPAAASNVDLLVALTHNDFDGSIYAVSPFNNPVTGCIQFISPASSDTLHGPMGLPIDVAICGHDHAIERFVHISDRGDGKNAYGFEAGSTQVCDKDNVFFGAVDSTGSFTFYLHDNQGAPLYKDCAGLLPRPRLGKARLAVGPGGTVVNSYTYLELTPRYHATFGSQTPNPTPTITISPGKMISLQAKFRNLGTRTWYNSSSNPDSTVVRLGVVSPRTASPDYVLPFVFSSGSAIRPANMSESSVNPGDFGTFTFQLTVAPRTQQGHYPLRVAPVADGIDGSEDWMSRGTVSKVIWDIVVNAKK